MQEESYYPLASLDGAEVSVQPTTNDQDILIQKSDLGRNLANLLALEDVEFVQQEDISYWRCSASVRIGETPPMS